MSAAIKWVENLRNISQKKSHPENPLHFLSIWKRLHQKAPIPATGNDKHLTEQPLPRFGVKIIVDEDADGDFEVTSVSFSSDETYSGSCPYTYTYKANITVKGEGDVVYYFKYSDGSTSSATTLAFDKNETRTASGSWTLSSSGDYWVKVYIKSPNNQTFGKAKLDLTCSNPTSVPTAVPTATTTPTIAPTQEDTPSSGDPSGDGETDS